MNRSDLVDAVAERAELDKKKATEAVTAVIDALIEKTSEGDKIAISGFGTFTPTKREARTGRNPRTGDPVDIAASNGVKFTPASAFKSRLNPDDGKAKAKAKKS